MQGLLSVIVPASNEAGYIGPCLAALFASDPVPGGAEVIVVANGCRDDTAAQARAFADKAQGAGWGFQVLERTTGGKPGALNAGDAVAKGHLRAYLDADVVVCAALMAQIVATLKGDAARYASGRALVPRAKSAVTRAYARFWQTLPFAQSIAPGYGLFAVNTAGRARWGDFPDIISDDTFARLQFTPQERIGCPASYHWPMVEGFAALVRVRRRQDAGVREIAALYPGLLAREGKAPLGFSGILRRGLSDPPGLAAYAVVSLMVKARPAGQGWTRGR
ncbi:glycosyltransferase family A protein [Pseudorhodobacter sp.]|uniref:glycosyltransferase family 2 protein n=1 Tax=Pseudorhodobacter sp. TaxID=1934400 RepID=UPI00264940A6|nr:glycosyltransferase family A protein [Pseudorhodobacter sp.]MDN5787430.1 glycosyltransferase family 2 protein [Pseudorhodobacter sp.]